MEQKLLQYACKAGAHEGTARCRNMEPCPVHNGSGQLAPRPEVVLIKINLNHENNILFANAGIPRRERSDKRREELGEEHRQRAERLGRDSLVIRERREGKENVDYPEAHDSGCAVFGSNGLHNGVDIRGLADQLLATGFCLTNAYRLDREQKPPIRLVMEFRRGQDRIPESQHAFPWLLLQQLVDTCFGQVDVWANDRDARDQVVHTVNCGQRNDDAEPVYALLYADGDWRVELRSVDNAA